MSEEKILELEMQIAFHDDAIQSLNEVIAKQDQQILIIQKQLKFLHDRIKKGGGEGAEAVADNEPPPHY